MWIWFYIKVNTCLTNQGLCGLSVVLCYSITVNSVMPASEHRENKNAWNKNARKNDEKKRANTSETE